MSRLNESQPNPDNPVPVREQSIITHRLVLGLVLLGLVWSAMWWLSSSGRLTPPASPTATPAPTATLALIATPTPAVTPTRTVSPAATSSPPVTPSPTPTRTSLPAATSTSTPTATPVVTGVLVYTRTITIPSHHFLPALVREESESYNMPYYRLDWDRYDPAPITDASFTLVILENEHLRVSLLPELGGRIYQLVDKSTGRNLLYQNPVLKPTRWGPPEMGWWLAAGGIEWCLPVEEHGYEWAVPWQYEVRSLSGRSGGPAGKEVFLWDTDAQDRLQAHISVSLYPDEVRLHISPTIINPTRNAITFKFWLNAMVAPAGDNRLTRDTLFLFPAEDVIIHSTSDERLPGADEIIPWPVYDEVDWSRLGNWHQWFGFFQFPRAEGGIQAVFDVSTGSGLVRTYDDKVARGAKFFGLGWEPDALPSDLYTDDDSDYVEMHGGLAPTFAGNFRLPAGKSVAWRETWYPVSSQDDLPAIVKP